MSEQPSFEERVFWSNQKDLTMGEWKIIPRRVLQAALIVFCLTTPFTNFLLVFLPKIQEVRY